MKKTMIVLAALLVCGGAVVLWAAQDTTLADGYAEVRDPVRLKAWLETNATDAETRIAAIEAGAGAGTFTDSITVATNASVGGTIELGHASDTTLSRASAGVMAVEGKNVYMAGGTDVAVADGGTGLSAGTSGGILAFTATGTLASSGLLAQYGIVLGGGAGAAPATLAASANTGAPLLSAGASANPAYGALNLAGGTNIVTGALPVANGGSGASTLTGLLKGNGTSAFTAAVASTDYLTPAAGYTGTNTIVDASFTNTIIVIGGQITSWTQAAVGE